MPNKRRVDKTYAAGSKKTPHSEARSSADARHGGQHADFMALQWYRERGDVDLDHFLLSLYVVRLGALVERQFNDDCEARYGIIGSDMRVLFALRRAGPPYALRPTDLFRSLLVTSGAVTKKVDRLIDLGYVEKTRDPAHGGGFLIHLTKEGFVATDDALEFQSRNSVLEPALQQLGKGKLRQALRFASQVLSIVEPHNTHAAAAEPASPAKARGWPKTHSPRS